MDLENFRDDDSIKYQIETTSQDARQPTGIHIKCHRDNPRKEAMARLKLWWEDFELKEPISN